MLKHLILPKKGRILSIIATILYIIPIALWNWDMKTDVHIPQWAGFAFGFLILLDAVIIPCVIGAKYEKLGLSFVAPTAAASFSSTISIGTIGFFMLAIQAIIVYVKGLIIMLTCILRFIFTYIYKAVSVLRFKSHSKNKRFDMAEDVLDNLLDYELISEKMYDKYSAYCTDTL